VRVCEAAKVRVSANESESERVIYTCQERGGRERESEGGRERRQKCIRRSTFHRERRMHTAFHSPLTSHHPSLTIHQAHPALTSNLSPFAPARTTHHKTHDTDPPPRLTHPLRSLVGRRPDLATHGWFPESFRVFGLLGVLGVLPLFCVLCLGECWRE
jgi:hypothetical protein